MMLPDIENSTREERQKIVSEAWACLHDCESCGKCRILKGKDAEILYADYIEGRRTYMDITLEIRNNNYQKNKMMDTKEKVLATMKEAGTPLNAGKIAELSGLDRKEVDKVMKQLKDEGAIISPVRCKWAPAE